MERQRNENLNEKNLRDSYKIKQDNSNNHLETRNSGDSLPLLIIGGAMAGVGVIEGIRGLYASEDTMCCYAPLFVAMGMGTFLFAALCMED